MPTTRYRIVCDEWITTQSYPSVEAAQAAMDRIERSPGGCRHQHRIEPVPEHPEMED